MNTLKFAFVFAVFMIVSCTERTKIKIEQELSCDDWKEIARLDISQKKMYIINYGLRDEFSDYFDRIKNKYHIEIKEDYGCLVSDGIFCYNDAMINYIESRLGNDIWDRIESEANELFYQEYGYMPYGPISPYFDFDSCIKYLPSISYQYSIEKFHKAMKKAEFISEAGEDSYYLWYSDLVMDSIIDRYGEVDSITAVIRNNFSEINQLFRCLAGGGTFYGHMEKRLEGYVAHYLWHGFQSNFLTEKSKVNINDSIKKMVLNNPDVWSVKLLDECFDDLKITISDPWLTKITLEYLKVYSHE